MKLPSADGEFDLTDDLIAAYVHKYPFLDIRAELLAINLWLHKNPARQPKLMLRFIDRWMTKARPKVVKPKLVSGGLSPVEIDRMGRELGLSARPGEDYAAYARRIRVAQS